MIFFEKILFSNTSEDKYIFEFKKIYIIQLIINLTFRLSILLPLLYNTDSIFYFVIKIIIFYIVLLINFVVVTQINHIHEENFTYNKNFYKHQIITSNNVLAESNIMRFLTGGLNCQIEHHLFPSINSCHLPAISKIIRRICKKYDIKYNEYKSIYQAILDTIKTVKKINPVTAYNYNFKFSF